MRLFEKKRVRKRWFFLCVILACLLLACIVTGVWYENNWFSFRFMQNSKIKAVTTTVEEADRESEYVRSIRTMNVDKPVKRTKEEAIQHLLELGSANPNIMEIGENSSFYPDDMLINLANNPEMAGFVAGYTEPQESANASLTDEEKNMKYPLFLQWDPRWGYQQYGENSIVGIAGCGPTCLAMVLFYLTGDEMHTPDKIASYAVEKGYYLEGFGTAWKLMDDVPRLYGIKVKQPKLTERNLKSSLDKGKIAICSMDKGDFTLYGHFIVILGYDEEGFQINDPFCVARSRKRWTYEELETQIKGVWVYEKE